MKSESVHIQMKATEQRFPVGRLLYKLAQALSVLMKY